MQELRHNMQNVCISLFEKDSSYILRLIRWAPNETAATLTRMETALNTAPYTYGSDQMVTKAFVDSIMTAYPKNATFTIHKEKYGGLTIDGLWIERTLLIPELDIEGRWGIVGEDGGNEIDIWVEKVLSSSDFYKLASN